MEIKIDFRFWMNQYAKDYPRDAEGKYPIFVDEKGVEHEEKSPYFETISKVLRKRGYLLKKEFVSIGNWKAERQKSRYESNTDEDVRNITKEMFEAADRDKVKILDHFEGVGIPVASAILTIVYPKEYCIIDYRTWRTLLWLRALAAKTFFTSFREYSDFLDTYDAYARTCKRYYTFRDTLKTIGEKRGMTPRQVEMAVWKFDKMKGEKT